MPKIHKFTNSARHITLITAGRPVPVRLLMRLLMRIGGEETAPAVSYI